MTNLRLQSRIRHAASRVPASTDGNPVNQAKETLERRSRMVISHFLNDARMRHGASQTRVVNVAAMPVSQPVPPPRMYLTTLVS